MANVAIEVVAPGLSTDVLSRQAAVSRTHALLGRSRLARATESTVDTYPKYARAERERRWLADLRNIGPLESFPVRHIDDLYLRGSRLRLRSVRSAEGVVFKLGKKYGKEPSGAEPVTTIYLTPAEYAALLPLAGYPVSKRRYTVGEGALDVYAGPPSLAIFEREFASAAEAAACTPPTFAIEEITDRPEYSGFALARAAAREG